MLRPADNGLKWVIPLVRNAVGCTVVHAGIRINDIPSFLYDILWGEGRIVSEANLTRKDGADFVELAPTAPVSTTVRTFPLERASEALANLREGRIGGTAVLVMVNGQRRI